MMGIFSVAFWLLKGSLILMWAFTIPENILKEMGEPSTDYLFWQGGKCFVRGVGIIFQVHFFTKIDGSFGRRREVLTNRWNFLYMPCLASIFLNSAVDSFSGVVEHLVQHANLSPVVGILYEAGEPIHLGFCVHLFLHFYIVNDRMVGSVKLIQD